LLRAAGVVDAAESRAARALFAAAPRAVAAFVDAAREAAVRFDADFELDFDFVVVFEAESVVGVASTADESPRSAATLVPVSSGVSSFSGRETEVTQTTYQPSSPQPHLPSRIHVRCASAERRITIALRQGNPLAQRCGRRIS
jgi:hypothetical protein